jgi:elongation factor G
MIKGGVIPTEFIPSVEKGQPKAMEHGPLKGYPLESMKITLMDGSFHAQDSAAFDFEIAARRRVQSCCRKMQSKTSGTGHAGGDSEY